MPYVASLWLWLLMSPTLSQKNTQKPKRHPRDRINKYKEKNKIQKLRYKMQERLSLEKNKELSVLFQYVLL